MAGPGDLGHDLALIISAAVKPGAMTATLETVGFLVENELKKEYSKPGSGQVYTRGGISHQASAPGEPPAPDTGQLRARIHHLVGHDAIGAFVEVGVNDPRGAMLEFGTRHIAPRPAFRTTTARMADQVGRAFAAGVLAQQRKAAARLPKEIQL